ncbi:HTH_Tnp_Tc3_2 domain-containing protein [Trichonephila clavipes]|nr:HTH_Tnp_Tc3_2 domain-containing protein [Trichonephila clavipes]
MNRCSVPEPDEIGNMIEEVVDLTRQINLEVDSDDVLEQLDSHSQALTIDEFIEIHEQKIITHILKKNTQITGNHQMARIVRHNDENVREGYIRNGGKKVKLFTSALRAFQCNNRIVMAQRKHLDDFLRDRIIGRLECGRTQLEVSEELGITQSVNFRLWQRFQDEGNVGRCYSTGLPRVTTPNEDRYLAVTAKRNRQNTASDLFRQLSSATGTTVSRQTVYRRLEHIGLYARRPVRCVPLTATHYRLRLTWSSEHALWTPQQWSFVMFSDKSRFSLQSDSRRTLIWRAPVTTKRTPLNDTVTVVTG